MGRWMLYLVLVFILSCKSSGTGDAFFLSISPVIDQQDGDNKLIIQSLEGFLQTKNQSLIENEYWLPSDFDKFVYPFLDIYKIEGGKYGDNFFRPTLMEIIPTDHSTQKVVKVAFIGHHPETKENQLKYIFNLIANIDGNRILFSRYLDFATENWPRVQSESLEYILSPDTEMDYEEVQKQHDDIQHLCQFFEVEPINITYYSCIHPKEIFDIKGFDYHPMMFLSETGGLADYGDIVFSGNHSEFYTHEIVHVYTNNLFPRIINFIDEGMATYIGGSGGFPYEWHRKKLYKFVVENPEHDFSAHMDSYERLYFEDETSIPYLTAALICERTHRIYGRAGLIMFLNNTGELWASLEQVGLTPENINDALRAELYLPILPVW